MLDDVFRFQAEVFVGKNMSIAKYTHAFLSNTKKDSIKSKDTNTATTRIADICDNYHL